MFCLAVCLDFATIVGDSLRVRVHTHLVVNEATYLDNVALFGSPTVFFCLNTPNFMLLS